MPVFLEKIILPVLAAAIILLAVTNPMKFDTAQRVSGALCLLFLGYFVSHTLHTGRNTQGNAPVSAKQETPTGTAKEPHTEAPDPVRHQETAKNHPKHKSNPLLHSGIPALETPVVPPKDAGPPVLKLMHYDETISSTMENLPYGLQVVVQTNLPIKPTNIRITFDGEVGFARAMFAPSGPISSSNMNQKVFGWGKNLVELSFSEPEFTPRNPLQFTVLVLSNCMSPVLKAWNNVRAIPVPLTPTSM